MNLLIVVFYMGILVKKYILNHLKQHLQNFDTFTSASISLYANSVMINH